jgi:hypothetical protein
MRSIVEILGLVLPFVIILLALPGVFGKRNLNGWIIFAAVLLLLAGIIRYVFYSGSGSSGNGAEPQPLAVREHSSAFNQSLTDAMEKYFTMNEGFVNWDTAIIHRNAADLKSALDSLNLEELKKDSLIYLSALDPINNARAELNSIIADPSLDEKRGSLNILSDNLRNLLVIVQYDQQKLYWQECPMAFGDNRPGNWLSKTKEVRNPYLGTKDPKYGASMLECGGPRDTINFTRQPTNNNE